MSPSTALENLSRTSAYAEWLRTSDLNDVSRDILNICCLPEADQRHLVVDFAKAGNEIVTYFLVKMKIGEYAETPAHLAASENAAGALDLLGKVEANLNWRNFETNMTPLDIAEANGFVESAAVIKKHIAAQEAAKRESEMKAFGIDTVKHKGLTPFDIAKAYGHTEIVAVLEERNEIAAVLEEHGAGKAAKRTGRPRRPFGGGTLFLSGLNKK